MGEEDSGFRGFGGFEKAQKGPYAYNLLVNLEHFKNAILKGDMILAHQWMNIVYAYLYKKMRNKITTPWPIPPDLLKPYFNSNEKAKVVVQVLEREKKRLLSWLSEVIDVLYEEQMLIEFKYRGVTVEVEE
jgi:hypothetical protein